MPDIYPLPTENETIGFQQFAQYINNVSGNLFFPLALLSMFIILWVSTINFGGARSFTFASLCCSILAMLLVVGGFLSATYMYFLFVMVAVGFLFMMIGKSSRNFPQI